MNTIKNSMPNIYYSGTDDQSTSELPIVNEARPVHQPHIFTLGQQGSPDPFVAGGKGLVNMLGAETFNTRGKFYTHATALLEQMNAAGNLCQVQRLIPDDADTSTVQLCLELVEQDVPIYNRNADGSYELDGNGDKIPSGSTTLGYIGQWIVRPIPEKSGVREVGVTPTEIGTLTGPQGETSLIYPIHDIKASFVGEYGNGVGVRIWPTYDNGSSPLDVEMVQDQMAYIYNLEFYAKATLTSSAVRVTAQTGVKTVPFALKDGAIDTNSDADLFADEVIMPSYRDLDDTSSGVPAYGPVEDFYTYHDNVALISKKIFTTELGLSEFGTTDPAEGLYLINLYQGKHWDAVPYHSFVLHGMADGAAEMTSISTHYLNGGSDGDCSKANFDTMVATQLENYGQLDYLFDDMARYPMSAFIDSGFSSDTKKLIPTILGVRPNMHVAIGTHVVGGPRLTMAQESSLAIALRAALRAYPESTFFGTDCCRGVIIPGCGQLEGSTYKELVPGTFEIAIKRAQYMGAGSGIFNSSNAYDSETGRVVKYLKNMGKVEMPTSVRNQDWDLGLNRWMNFDTKNIFMPGVKTVYSNDTSVLTNDINMMIMCELNTVAFYVWRDLVGNSRLTKAQVAERSNERIIEYVQFRFDGRVTIVPDTYYTPADDARGYSWSTKINMYANNAPTVNQSTVITHRQEDLE